MASIEPIWNDGPNAPGIFEALTGIVAAANNLVNLRDALTATMGAELLLWIPAANLVPPATAIWQQGNTILVCFGGSHDQPWSLIFQISGGLSCLPVPGGGKANAAFLPASYAELYLKILAVFPSDLTNIDFIFAGHSLGGAYAFQWALELLNNGSNPHSVSVVTYGEPRSMLGSSTCVEPAVHLRIMNNGDPIPSFPPDNALQALNLIAALTPKTSLPFNFQHRGSPYLLRNGDLTATGETAVSYRQLVDGEWAGDSHDLVVGYYAGVNQFYAIEGVTNQDAAIYALAKDVQFDVDLPTGSFVVPNAVTLFNQTFFPGEDPGPATPENLPSWSAISGTPTFEFYAGGSTMTQFRGQYLFTMNQAGWSETIHSANPAETYASMLLTMQTLLPLRQKMMVTPLNPTLGDSNLIASIQAIRVSDDLLQRDGQVATANDVASIGAGFYENYPEENAWAVRMYNTPTQWAIWYFHAVPLIGPSNIPALSRREVPNPTWLTNLNNYIAAMRSRNCGFRTFVPTWWTATGTPPVYSPGPNSQILACVPSPVSGWWRITTRLSIPQQGATVRLTKFSGNMAFLNGRRPCKYVSAGVFDVTGNFPTWPTWNNSGDATLFTWQPVVINTVVPDVFTSRKVGRPFGLSAGRARRRLVS